METPAELFRPVPKDLARAQLIARPNTTYWQDAWRRLKKNPLAIIGLVIIVLMLAAAIFGPMFSQYSYSDQDYTQTYAPPSASHWFGTDSLGRDLFVRVLFGARISLAIGFFASLINLTVGVLYGGLSGYLGGRIDEIMMRIVDVLYTVPLVMVVILLMVVFSPGLKNILIALGLVYWVGMARIVRGQVLSLKEQEYILAARMVGAKRWRVLLRHLIPNSMGPIIVTATLNIPQAIFLEAFLSFIGLGVAAPMASWGVLADEGVQAMQSYPHLLFFPAAAICVAMLAFNFLGDGLRDALDPRMRR